MKKKLVLFGAREFAEVLAYYFIHDSAYELAAFTVDGAYMEGDRFYDRPVVPFEELEERFPAEQHDLFVAISYQKMNRIRAQKVAEAKAKGYGLAAFVSSKAQVWAGYQPQENSFVMEHNVVQPFSRIGRNSILWAGNHIGHHAIIGENCFLASHIVVSGMVRVGDFSFIGVNATLRDGITIGQASLIGAGALIMGDTQDEEVYVAEATKPRGISSSRLKGF